MIHEYSKDDPAPTWADLVAAGHAVKYGPGRRVAVFMGGSEGYGGRAVILATEGPLSGSFMVEADEIDAVCAALQALKPEITALQRKSDVYLNQVTAKCDTNDLIDRLREGRARE